MSRTIGGKLQSDLFMVTPPKHLCRRCGSRFQGSCATASVGSSRRLALGTYKQCTVSKHCRQQQPATEAHDAHRLASRFSRQVGPAGCRLLRKLLHLAVQIVGRLLLALSADLQHDLGASIQAAVR